jgi:hypothetical protein
MNTLSRLLILLAGVCLLAVGPAQAQTDNGGNTPATVSDQSGASVTNSDAVFFQSDEAQIRMNDVASSLTQALQRGRLGPSVVGRNQSVTVPSAVSELFFASSREDVAATTQQFLDVLTAKDLPKKEAKALARSVAGLLDGSTVSISQFRGALEAYNAAVNTAPVGFLVQPPHEFIVVRAVLTALLEGAV